MGEHIASHGADLKVKNVETLFVYCNVLEHAVVGDVMTPLLRIVDMKCKAEHLIHRCTYHCRRKTLILETRLSASHSFYDFGAI